MNEIPRFDPLPSGVVLFCEDPTLRDPVMSYLTACCYQPIHYFDPVWKMLLAFDPKLTVEGEHLSLQEATKRFGRSGVERHLGEDMSKFGNGALISILGDLVASPIPLLARAVRSVLEGHTRAEKGNTVFRWVLGDLPKSEWRFVQGTFGSIENPPVMLGLGKTDMEIPHLAHIPTDPHARASLLSGVFPGTS